MFASFFLFVVCFSPLFFLKVRIVLTEKGLLYRHENVNVAKPPDGWRELSPLGKIPAFKGLRSGACRVVGDLRLSRAPLSHAAPLPFRALRLRACAVV